MDKEWFASFDWFHPSRSSEVSLLPTEGIVKKVKHWRSWFYRSQEYFALHVWHAICHYYNNQYKWVRVLSPKPIAVVPDENAILMSLVPWIDLSRLNNTTEAEKIEELGYKIWYLFRIKEIEWLKHGDFQPRHLVDTRDSTIWIIDVEWAKYEWMGSSQETIDENKAFVFKLLALPVFNAHKTILLDSINRWWAVVPTNAKPVIEDLIKDIHSQYGIGSSKFRTRKSN